MQICSAMSTNRSREEFGPVTRNRSSSANEASKPILVRQTHAASKTLNFSPSNGGSAVNGKSYDLILFSIEFFNVKNKSSIYTISNQKNTNTPFDINLFCFPLHFIYFRCCFCFIFIQVFNILLTNLVCLLKCTREF